MTLPRADACLSRQLRVLKSMAEMPGLRIQEAQIRVSLTNHIRNDRDLNQQLLCDALAKSLERRMGFCLVIRAKNSMRLF